MFIDNMFIALSRFPYEAIKWDHLLSTVTETLLNYLRLPATNKNYCCEQVKIVLQLVDC